MKRLLFTILYYVGVPALFRFFHRRSLTVVLYHGVAPALSQGIYNYRKKFISPEAFDAQLAYFDRYYTVLPLEKALDLLREGTLPPYTLSITFDDGYRNFADYAYPHLSKRQMPSTMFVATDFVFRNIPLWVDRLEYAIGREDGSYDLKTRRDAAERDRLKRVSPQTREQSLRAIEQISLTQFVDFSGDRSVYAPLTLDTMRDLQLRNVRFGAHTRTHPILSKLSAAEQDFEIGSSREDLHKAGIGVSPVFAYPNGQAGEWDTHSIDTLQKHGFTHALTTVAGFNTAQTPHYALRRMVLDGTDDFPQFANVVTGVRLFLKSFI